MNGVAGSGPFRRSVPGLFMAGPWEGRLAELPYLPQDLTVAEYLSPANCLF